MLKTHGMLKFVILLLVLFAPCFSVQTSEEINFKDGADAEERRQICLGELGCFRNTQPFDEPTGERLVSLLPDTREEINTEFRFFKAGTDQNVQKVLKNSDVSSWAAGNSEFDPKLKTKFIVHGYLGGNADWAVRLKNALVKKNCNVFIVDWTNGHGPLYEQAVANIRVVGAEIGVFIQKLMSATQLNPQNVHIIGHSLGSHASGYAGKWVQGRDRNINVGRITGLDPAGPYFNDVFPVVRLDRGDASFVDVIHTNWGANRFQGFGIFEPIGHFDFFPNGGEDQPGCPTAGDSSLSIIGEAASYVNGWAFLYKKFKGSSEESIGDKIDDLSCSHGRAYEYFIASIEDEDCEFKSLQCFSWDRYLSGECGSCQDHKCVVMGYYADKYKKFVNRHRETSTKFYLKTKSTFPYCLEKDEVRPTVQTDYEW